LRLDLRLKVPLLVGGLLVALGAALYGSAYWRVRQAAARAASERLTAVAHQIAGLLEGQAVAISHAVLIEARQEPVIRSLTSTTAATTAAAFAALRRGNTQDTSIAGLVLRDPAGTIIATDGPLGKELGALIAPEELPASSADTALVGRFRALGEQVYFPAIAALADSGRRLGYVVVWRRIGKAPHARGPVAALIGSEAMLRMGSRSGAWMDESGPATAPDLTAPVREGLLRYDRPDGPVIAALVDVPGAPWSVAVEFPLRVMTAPAHKFLRDTAPMAGGILILGLLLAWLLGRQLIAPLAQLTSASEAMGPGAHETRVTIARTDEIGRLGAAFNRMAERVEQEVAGRAESEAQWRRVFEGSPHPKWVYDLETRRMVAVNPAALMQYGYSTSEFLALTPDALEAPSGEANAVAPETRHHRTKEGVLLEVEVTEHDLTFGGREARFVLSQNVSARAALEARLRQAQKMQAIGRLAGGVAHDFNNFLTVIGAYAELLRDGLDAGDPRAQDLGEILHASHQANLLTKQLLSFSRQQVLQPAILDANGSVGTMSEMLRRLIGEDIRLITKLEAREPRVRLDPGQFEQVLLNLAINARDAMPAGGALTISTSDIKLDEGSAALHGLEKEGDYVVLSVADSGIGMSAETRARIFEPFFTTKGVGKGTGLGLATVYGIITQSGGDVTVYSEPGIGTTFRIYLPRLRENVSPDIAAAVVTHSTSGHETILLVEDEAAVRSAARQALVRQGYTVLTAAEATEAMAIVEGHEGELHLVVSDVVMPGIDGPTLVVRLKVLRPGLRALLMSGYAGDALSRSDALGKGVPFIEKPFTVMGLAKKVREVLDG
jgi:PAS domain S-box-containing protein